MQSEVTLRFRNDREKNKFLTGLADGFGEEYCQLFWGAENGVSIFDAKVIDVTPWGALDIPSNEDDEDEFDDFGLSKMRGDD